MTHIKLNLKPRLNKTKPSSITSSTTVLSQQPETRQISTSLLDPRTWLPHQARAVKHIQTHRSLVLDHKMGTGKTKIAILCVMVLQQPALVIVPSALQDNFLKEIDKHGADRRLFHIVSFNETLQTESLSARHHVLVVDEVHLLRNAQGKFNQQITRLAREAQKVILLSGTILINGPRDLAPVANMVLDGKTKVAVKKWMGLMQIQYDKIPTGDYFDREFGEDGLNHRARELFSAILPCFYSYYNPPPSPEFPTLEYHERFVEMHPVQQAFYDQWESGKLTREMAQTMTTRQLLTSDISAIPHFKAYLQGGRRIGNVVEVDQHVYCPKIDALLEDVKQENGQSIVYSAYISSGIDVLKQKLDQHGITYVTFTGKESRVMKHQAVQDYNAGKVRVFLMSSAGGVGLDLKETQSVHLLEPDWNEGNPHQVIYRACRLGSHQTPGATVKVYQYYSIKKTVSWWSSSKVTSQQSKKRKVPLTFTADMYLKQVAEKKARLNQQFYSFARQYSIESEHGCQLQGFIDQAVDQLVEQVKEEMREQKEPKKQNKSVSSKRHSLKRTKTIRFRRV